MVRIFVSASHIDLEKNLNDWLKERRDFEIKSIGYSFDSNLKLYTALVYYVYGH